TCASNFLLSVGLAPRYNVRPSNPGGSHETVKRIGVGGAAARTCRVARGAGTAPAPLPAEGARVAPADRRRVAVRGRGHYGPGPAAREDHRHREPPQARRA